MRTLSSISVMVAILALFLITTQNVNAERVLTEVQMESIKSSCKTVQTEMNTLHSQDALMRVNVGQQYENVLTSLMSPLNSRLAINQVDTVSLVTTSVDYTATLKEFRKDYSVYESSMRSVMDMKCEQDPVAFYTGIEMARKNRIALHQRVVELNAALVQYKNDYGAAKLSWEKNRG